MDELGGAGAGEMDSAGYDSGLDGLTHERCGHGEFSIDHDGDMSSLSIARTPGAASMAADAPPMAMAPFIANRADAGTRSPNDSEVGIGSALSDFIANRASGSASSIAHAAAEGAGAKVEGLISRIPSTVTEGADDLASDVGSDVSARPESMAASMVHGASRVAALSPARADAALKGMSGRGAAKLASWDAKSDRAALKSDLYSSMAERSRRDGGKPSVAERFWLNRAGAADRKSERLSGNGPGVRGKIMRFRRRRAAGAVRVAGGACKVLAGCGAAAAMALICIPMLMMAAGAAFGALGFKASESPTSLNEVESTVLAFFRGKGLGDVQIAGIMGNMQKESGMDPSRAEAGGTGIGLCQWSFGRADKLRRMAAERGVPWTDLGFQLEFFWDHDIWQTEWGSTYRVSGGYANPSPAPGTRVSGSKAGFMAAASVEDATEQFCYGWEKAGFPRIDGRIAEARRYYDAIAGAHGSGQEYDAANAAQRKVADIALSGDMFGYGSGWCQAWVAAVYAHAGHPFMSSCCATSAGDRWIVSTSRDGIPVGATVYGLHSSSGTMCGGQDAGHVAIYVGGGMVVSNEGGAAVKRDLASFSKIWGYRGWGWNGGLDLSAMD